MRMLLHLWIEDSVKGRSFIEKGEIILDSVLISFMAFEVTLIVIFVGFLIFMLKKN
jgi:hypothetical protein